MSDGMPDRQRLTRAIHTVLCASRRQMEVSQRELAQRMGVTRNTIANFESGRRAVRLADFLMIANALNIDPIALLHRVLRW